MNSITHVASAGVVSQIVLCLDPKLGARLPAWSRPAARVFACLALGVASHLLLDRIPHHGWVLQLGWFSKWVRFYWILTAALFGALTMIVVLAATRDRWMLTCVAAFGASLPDFEKVACTDVGILPARWVLLRGHTFGPAPGDWGMRPWALIAMEASLDVALVLLTFRLARARAARAAAAR